MALLPRPPHQLLRPLLRPTTQRGGGGRPVQTTISGLVNALSGVWYDISDISTLFQDVAGTIPVTTSGQTVARINDKGPLGAHLLQATGGLQPVYNDAGGLQSVVGDGADDTMGSTAGVYTPIQGRHYLGMAVARTVLTANQNFLGMQETTTRRHQIISSSSQARLGGRAQDVGGTSIAVTANGDAPASTPLVADSQWSATSVDIKVGATALVTTAGTTTGGVITNIQILLGSGVHDWTFYGAISAHGELYPSERLMVQNYLNGLIT
jgi:hypothetical protein